jgi:predicted TIM-barrel fold metal-dependent hydrolase
MDEAGVDVQILSHTVPGPEELEPQLALELARQANDAAGATVTQRPNRFRAFATLPMRDPKAAAQELEGSVRKLGFVGALINGHVNGRYLDDKFSGRYLNVPKARTFRSISTQTGYKCPLQRVQPFCIGFFLRKPALVGMLTRAFMFCG